MTNSSPLEMGDNRMSDDNEGDWRLMPSSKLRHRDHLQKWKTNMGK